MIAAIAFPPNGHATAVLLLTALALFLFTRERIPLELSSLFVVVALAVGFELFPYESGGQALGVHDFFAGFGHEALVAVCALMIAGQGLVRTGALEPVGRSLSRMWVVIPRTSLLITLVVSAVLSAFLNNVPIVVLFLPLLVGVSLRTQTPASSVLMPMGFATLLGGMSTTIGTSTNLLVVSVAADLGVRRFHMFDFLLPVVAASVPALAYLWLVAPKILPKRTTALSDRSPRVFEAALNIPEGSFADGKTLSEVLRQAGGTMKVGRVRRGQGVFLVPLPDAVIQAGDRLLVSDTPENLKEYEQALGAALYAGDDPVDEEHPLAAEDQQLAEVVVAHGSPLDGTTLSGSRFPDRYQLVTLALHRVGWRSHTLNADMNNVKLRIGDVLLVQGAREQIADLKRSGELLVLDATSDLPSTKKASLSLLIMAGVVAAAATGLLPISISAVFGVLLMLASGCLTWRDAERALNTQVILIVVASLALGVGLLRTGAADYLARLFVSATADLSPAAVLSGLMLVMALFTNIVSNNAAAVIGTPIAVGIARQMQLPEEPFVLAVLFGANMSYATPVAYKTNLLVMNAGGYRFADFLRIGMPLTVIMWLSLSWLLRFLYDL